MKRYVAFLRGINVGGHHKVPMADLRKQLEKLSCDNVVTILNSGNIVFDASNVDLKGLEKSIENHLEKVFEFSIPTILREAELISGLLDSNPFKDVVLTKDIRLYVSFLRMEVQNDLQLPWTSDDRAFKIISMVDNSILSILDLSVTNTPKGMDFLERYYSKDMTTRNWNTIKRIGKKI